MKHRGYSLVEVIIAIALLAWVSLAISGLFIYGPRGWRRKDADARHRTLSEGI